MDIISLLTFGNKEIRGIQLKNNSKLITSSHYMRNVYCGTYSEDDRELLSDFLEITHSCTKNQTNATDTTDIPNVPHHGILFKKYEINILCASGAQTRFFAPVNSSAM